jgi:uncharacterized protein (DUF4213/DUF364 family)
MKLEETLLASVNGDDLLVKGAWVGLTWTAIESRFIGLSHTYRTSEIIDIENAGDLTSCTISNLTKRILSWKALEASIGIAAINSLIEPRGIKSNIKDFINEKSRGKTVTFIGRFPFYEEISPIAKKSYLLEINATVDELPTFACEEILPKSDVNVITGTSLINHSLQRLLELGQNGINIVLGPTTPLSPVLFDFGADVLAGIKVIDKQELVKSITQGVRKSKLINGLEPVCLYNKTHLKL